MALVDSLLTAMVRANGDALVLHVGEKPYVVTQTGPIDLSTHGLNLQAMTGMLSQLIPADVQHTLRELGAVEHKLPPLGADQFTLVAARGGDDIWIEIRRRREEVAVSAPPKPAESPKAAEPLQAPRPEPVAAPGPDPIATPKREPVAAPKPAIAAPILAAVVAPETEPIAAPKPEPVVASKPEPVAAPTAEPVMSPKPEAVVASRPEPIAAPPPEPIVASNPEPVAELPPEPIVASKPEPVAAPPPEPMAAPKLAPLVVPELEPAIVASQTEPLVVPEPEPVVAAFVEPTVAAIAASAARPAVEAMPAPRGQARPDAAVIEVRSEAPAIGIAPPQVSAPVHAQVQPPALPPVMVEPPAPAPPPVAVPVDAAMPAVDDVVVPLTRTVRIEVPARALAARQSTVERLLRLAVARGASALFLSSQSRPFVRIEGDVRPLDGESSLGGADIEAAVFEVVPEALRDGARRGEPMEWIAEIADLGRIRCISFRDQRGPGALFLMIATRAATADQLGLAREVQALATEAEGLVVVAGPRGSGKSTLLSAFVDLINRQRADYVITLERQLRLLHENRAALISQREIRGSADDLLAAARAALRENPDVFVVEDVNSAEMLSPILEAAGQGLLVFVSITAPSATEAVHRLVEMVPAEDRAAAHATLAETFRGAVAQVLLRKAGGGRVAARELLLATGPVSRLIADGKFGELPLALESGRQYGMVPLTDTLVGLVQSGAVDVREAYRKAGDRERLLAGLRREGVDTSFVERLA